MTEFIEWMNIIISSNKSFEYIIIFLGAVVGGEFALFTFGFLSAHSVLSVPVIIILSFVGALTPNIFWFLLGKTNLANKLISRRYIGATYNIFNQAINKMSKGSDLIALTIIKFSIGTPLMLTMYSSKTKISFFRFIYYESFAVALSLLIIIPFGFISGLGFLHIIEIFHNIYVTLAFILLMIVLIISIKLFIKNRFTQDISI